MLSRKGGRMMSTPENNRPDESFDFDEWVTLAQHDPDEFERRREILIENFIRDLPPARQRRIRGLQFRIDMERRRARTPMGACIKFSTMMWDALLGPQGLRASLALLNSPAMDVASKHNRPRAQILSFRKN